LSPPSPAIAIVFKVYPAIGHPWSNGFIVEGVPMDLNGNGWNSERLIYLDHATVVPMEKKEEMKDNVAPPSCACGGNSVEVLKVDLKV